MKNLLADFKAFALKGNVVDMAVGVIVGGAFGKIVTSLVNDMLMPMIGILTGGVNISELAITFKGASIKYGQFFQNIIDFLIIAVSIYAFVLVINKLKDLYKKEEVIEEVKEEPKKPDDILLLEEIRDLLKNK